MEKIIGYRPKGEIQNQAIHRIIWGYDGTLGTHFSIDSRTHDELKALDILSALCEPVFAKEKPEWTIQEAETKYWVTNNDLDNAPEKIRLFATNIRLDAVWLCDQLNGKAEVTEDEIRVEIAKMILNRANLEHIAETRVINGSLLISLIELVRHFIGRSAGMSICRVDEQPKNRAT